MSRLTKYMPAVVGYNGGNGPFAKALLREISNMGRKTQEVFERSIEELHEIVVSAVLHDSRFVASLAIELLARNLYERAEYAIAVADPREPMIMVLNIGRLVALVSAERISEPVEVAA